MKKDKSANLNRASDIHPFEAESYNIADQCLTRCIKHLLTAEQDMCSSQVLR